MNAEEQVTISRKEYARLQRASLFLECLRSNGVDNWEGFNDAVYEFRSLAGEEP